MNSDLSEIAQEQLWLLNTSASRGRQSVANMMTSFAFSCLSHHRGVIGDAETPRFPHSPYSHGTPGSKSRARRRAHRSTPTRSQAGDLVGKYCGDQRRGNTQFPRSPRSHGTRGSKSPATPTRSQAGDLVGKYGVQASATDLEALPLCPNPPPGNSTLGSSVPHSPPRSESKRPVERPSSSDRPVQSEHVPVTPGPGKGQMYLGPGTRWPVSPTTPGKQGTPTTPGSPGAPVTPGSPVTPDASVRPVYTGQKAQRKRPTSAWICLSFLFLIHRSDRCN